MVFLHQRHDFAKSVVLVQPFDNLFLHFPLGICDRSSVGHRWSLEDFTKDRQFVDCVNTEMRQDK